MLFNPKWAPATVSGVIAFLEQKPSGKAYDFHDCKRCAAAQFMKSIGWSVPDHTTLMNTLPQIAYATIFANRPWTFGAALERARELLGAEGVRGSGRRQQTN